ncbi:hypothetical protein I7I50_00612 [Histoplasma capsulatum G186AR]|uniref:Uncharacterized protein n=1 Tax=Ajellomyces capsulatus TaxID=5037 RepID=A0A8H7YJA0_AJECA|nr:hypothetical protein I7I52_07880 [Histoplasma capsulatum]QSS72688.1 hypothetical protein I7I50_00612 [Histoplasma capsulatum G186AR]
MHGIVMITHLLSHDDVQIVLCLIDVAAEGYNAADAGGVRFAWAGRGRVHDAVLGTAEKIGRAAQSIEHARAHDTGAVGVGVDVYFDWGVHADHAEAADDFRGVGHLLGAQEQFIKVAFPVIIEPLEAVWRESDGGGSGEVQVAGVEEVEEGVLKHLGPHAQVAEVGAAGAETPDDSVGNVSNAGLDGEKVVGEMAHFHFMLEKFDDVFGNSMRSCVRWGVWLRPVGIVGFNNGNDLLGINWDVCSSDAVFGCHNQIWFSPWRLVAHSDVMEAFERRSRGIDLDDYFLRHLNQLWRSPH